ncbi:hypothetical protein [Nesterenkonia marinintestina]|uniref:hypothetical protein n=1 Tax=Nesterenkonia marinintestina TaxID=2979865 RepID=UPI0021BE703D|nr:hypothetical protein [Nesterenkonia sp. GX14115]
MSSQSLPPSGVHGGSDRSSREERSGPLNLPRMTFAVMITVLLVALVLAANQNDVIGWIIAAISAGWLLLAACVVLFVRRGARKVGETIEHARADQAARNSASGGGTVVVDEDAHTRNLKLDHSFKIVQVQKRVIAEELERGGEADIDMVLRSLETIEQTAHNGRDMLADLVGRRSAERTEEQAGEPAGEQSDERPRHAREDRTRGDDDGTISGSVVR